MGDAAKFLRYYPPFNGLEPGELQRISGFVVERRIPPGEAVLVEDGPPGQWLFVVREGTMELTHRGEVVDILTVGEVFGTATLLTELSPEFTVRTREEVVLYLIPRRVAVEVLSGPGGVAYVARTYRERLVRTARTVSALPEARTVAVSSLIRRAPVFCEPGTPIREAARVMSDEVVTAVLVRTVDGLGIITDADLRDKVLAAGVSPETPVSAIMTAPVKTIRAEQLAPEASIEMMASGVNHLPVVDAQGNILGVISAGSLMTPDALSPFALHGSIVGARNEEEVVAAAAGLPQVFVGLLDARLDPLDISRILSLQEDSLTIRLLELAMERHGPPPVSYAWLVLGSGARGELTLASDQDNALAYGDADDPEVDAYFARLAADVDAGLERCGFHPDPTDVLARNRRWRMSQSQWKRAFAECLEVPDRSHLVQAAIAFDFRQVTGGLDIASPLVGLMQAAPLHSGFLARLARTATDVRIPLGFRARLRGPLDLKKSAALPIVNLARFHALAHGISVSATLDRLVALEGLGALDDETAKSLKEAFTIVWQQRLRHHAAAIETGRPPDDMIDPEKLRPVARLELQQALHAVLGAQKQLSHYVPLGM